MIGRALRLAIAGMVVLAVIDSAVSLHNFHWKLLITYPLFIVLYALMAGIVFGWFGRAFGLSNLFWHERGRTQFGAGVSVVALMLIVNVVSYEILRDLDGDRRMRDMRDYRDDLLWFTSTRIEEGSDSGQPLARFPVDLAEVDMLENGAASADPHAGEEQRQPLHHLIEEANAYARYEIAHRGRGHNDPAHEPEWHLPDQLRLALDRMLADHWEREAADLPPQFDPVQRAGIETVEYFRHTYRNAALEGGIQAFSNRTLFFLCGSMLPWVGLFALPWLVQGTFVERLWLKYTKTWFGWKLEPPNFGAGDGWPFVAGLFLTSALVLYVAVWWLPHWTTPIYQGMLRGEAIPSTRAEARWPLTLMRINAQLMLEIFLFQFAFLLLLIGFILVGRRPWISNWVVTPPVALCLVFGLFSIGYGLFVHSAFIHPLAQFVVFFLILWALILKNFSPYKLGFPILERIVKRDARGKLRGVSLKDRGQVSRRVAPSEALLDSAEVLDRWRAIAPAEPNADGERRPILAVVATSGGSMRAGVWTARVLQTIEQRRPGFPYNVRLITGASGGMLGAGLFAATVEEPNPSRSDWPQRSDKALEQPLKALPSDSLSEVARCLALYDLPRIVRRGPFDYDRGRALERVWESSHPAFALSFRDLAAGERAGWRPSTIFSPMLVEDGRRLLISNLDLEHLTLNTGAFLIDQDSKLIDPDQRRFESEEIYSRSAYEFFRLFPEARDFRLSTAMRMSATFPFISPAVSLPTDPPRRVVDAGYYDNYGINTAAMWLAYHRDWLATNTAGVVLIQIRAFDSPREIEAPQEVTDTRGNGSWTNAFKFVTSPVKGLLQARRAVMSYRNDEQLEWLSNWFRDQTGHSEFFQTVTFESPASASLSWHITEEERAEILKSFGDGEALAQVNWDRLSKLEDWWSQAPSRTPRECSSA